MSKYLPFVLALGAVAFCGTASAHAKLLSSNPANNARLAVAPQTLSLKFNEDVQMAVLKLQSDTTEIPIPIESKSAATATVTIRLPSLAPGNYQVTWSALSPRDGHIMKGHLGFSILIPK